MTMQQARPSLAERGGGSLPADLFQRKASRFLSAWQEYPLYSSHPNYLHWFGQRIRVLTEMGNDTEIASMIQGMKFPIEASRFRLDPGGKNIQSKEMAKCITKALNINREGILEKPWESHVEEMLTCIDFGFSISERVLGYMDDGKIGVRQLNHIPAIYMDWYQPWVVQRGELVGIRQQMIYEGRRYSQAVPYNRLLHFKYAERNNQPDGRSPLVACWSDWKNRRNLEEFEMIGVEHDTGGTPIVYPPRAIDEAKAQDVLDRILDVKLGGNIGIMMPGRKAGIRYWDEDTNDEPAWLVEAYAGREGGVAGARPIIKDLGKRILSTVFMQWSQLGQDSSGSFALARVTMDFFLLNLMRLQERMVSVWQRELVQKLYQYNLRFYPQAKCPKLTWNPPRLQDLRAQAQVFAELAAMGILEPTNLDGAFFRSIMGMPDDENAEKLQIVLGVSPTGQGSGTLRSGASSNEPQGANGIQRMAANYDFERIVSEIVNNLTT